ncbi:MAG: molybdenum cofactor guanylyltransferase MobA [Gammaproteobacteria bacterium]|jgi:molybdopterin-guanine dinucleotide biosynthesis protein A
MSANRITGVVLAGGLGTRLNGDDKGLVEINARAMVSFVVERFAPQVDALVINANRNLERYRAFGFPVIPDAMQDYPGPLAGIGAALAYAKSGRVACAPCDCPFLPTDFVARLKTAMDEAGAEVSYAVSVGRPQPVFAVIECSLLDSLTNCVNDGERKLMNWYRSLNSVAVDFGDDPVGFANINTNSELTEAKQRLRCV